MYLCIKESSDKVFIYVPFVTGLLPTTSNNAAIFCLLDCYKVMGLTGFDSG